MEEILITGAGSQMQGVGRQKNGMAVFVPGALPGERVQVEIKRRAERYCEGELVRILAPSEARRSSPCPYYPTCGGCNARHMSYAYSLSMKRDRVRDALVRLGGIESPNVLPVLGCENPERYRNKAEYAITIKNGHPIVGARGTDKSVLALSDCLLQRENSVAALRLISDLLPCVSNAQDLRGLVTRENRKGELMLILTGISPTLCSAEVLSKRLFSALPALKSFYYCRLKPRPTHALDGECRLISGSRTLQETIMGLEFSVSPQSFFQVNPEQAERLYALAISGLDLPENHGEARVFDAYCGTGTISLAMARHAHVTGVEIVPSAIHDANANARRNGLAHRARFVLGDAAREIPRLISSGEHFDAAIVDPPRKGCDRALIDSVIACSLPRLAYISCDPATLARDIRLLTQGGYRLVWAQPVDMFPWTAHVETVVLLSKGEIDPAY